MRKGSVLIAVMLFVFSLGVFSQNIPYAGGRIVISSDGNEHDEDDWAATPFSLALLASQGLQDQLKVYTFSDHIWGSNIKYPVGSNKTSIGAKAEMRISALDGKTMFKFTNTNFIEAVDHTTDAYNAIRDEILVSSSSNKLYIIAAGPMQVVGEAIKKAYNDAGYTDQLNHVRIISHSKWNDRHSDKPEDYEPSHSGWTWTEIENQFKGKGLKVDHILDQNGDEDGNEYDGMRAAKSKFSWLLTSSYRNNPAYTSGSWDWLYSRQEAAEKGTEFDPSDAGLIIYLLTGIQKTEPSDAKDLMENPVDNGSTCATPGETTVSKSNATCGSSDGKIKFTFNDTDGRSSISFSINGGSNYTKVGDNTASYTFSNLAEGTYNCWVKWGNGDCPTSLGNVVVGCSGGTSTVETVFVVNKSTGYKIRVKTDEGNAIAQAPSEWTGTWMQWEVINTSNGYFRLKFRGNNQYLSMPTTADGDVVYASGNTTTKEEWKKVDKGNGYFLLENKASGKRIRARADANMSIGGDYLVEVSKIGWEGDWVQWKFEDASAYKSAKMDSEIASSEASEFTVYPNPASQFITLHAPNASPNAMVTIYTIGGKSVLHTTMSGVSTHVNIEGLQSGIYFIQLKDAQTTSSKKLIIQ